jgi:hypothetical protein
MKSTTAMLVLASLVLLSGCNLIAATAPSAGPQTASPSPDLPPAPSEELLPGKMVFQNIVLTMPTGLCDGGTSSRTIDVEYPYINPSFGPMPEHVSIALTGCKISGSQIAPQITVSRADEYAQYSELTDELVASLRSLQAHPKDSLPDALMGSHNFRAQVKMLASPNGIGVRHLSQILDAFVPITNSELFYYYQGLSADGVFLITVRFPVHTAFLVEDDKSPAPADGLAFPEDLSGESVREYVQAITLRLDETPTDAFTPALSLLDALVESIVVNPL